jgi:ATP-binding cassette subfamily C protein LapB
MYRSWHLTLEEWHNTPPQGDELLACISVLAAQNERPSSPASIRAGLALDEAGLLPFHQTETALDQIGLRGEATTRRLRGWQERDLPAILSVGTGRSLILHAINGKACEIQMPGSADRVWLNARHLRPSMPDRLSSLIPTQAATAKANGPGKRSAATIGSGTKSGRSANPSSM